MRSPREQYKWIRRFIKLLLSVTSPTRPPEPAGKYRSWTCRPGRWRSPRRTGPGSRADELLVGPQAVLREHAAQLQGVIEEERRPGADPSETSRHVWQKRLPQGSSRTLPGQIAVGVIIRHRLLTKCRVRRSILDEERDAVSENLMTQECGSAIEHHKIPPPSLMAQLAEEIEMVQSCRRFVELHRKVEITADTRPSLSHASQRPGQT